MAEALLLVAATFLVLTGAFGLTVWTRPVRAAEALVTFLTFALAGFMLITIVVGALLRYYQPIPLACGSGVLAGAGLLCAGVELRRRPGVFGRRMTVWIRRSFRGWGGHPVTGVLALLTLTAYALRGWLGLRLPPTDWDGLSYHTTAPAQWAQSGSVGRATEVIWADTYPMGIESVAGWPMVFLGSAEYSLLFLLPGYLLAAVAIAGLARRVGAGRGFSVMAGFVFLLTPAVFAQAHTFYVDVQSAAFALAALHVLAMLPGAARLSGTPRVMVTRRMLTLGAALGAAAGSKSSNLAVLGVVGLAALVAVSWLARRHRLGFGVFVRAAPLLVLPVVAVGAYWYLRTWLNYDNPFYPITMVGFEGRGTVQEIVMGANVPEELRKMPLTEQLWTSWTQPFNDFTTPIYDIRLGGLGMSWLLIVLPGALLGLLVWLLRARRRLGIGAGLLLLLGVAVSFGPSPAPWWGRYVLLGYGCLLVFCVLFMSRLGEGRRAPARALDGAVQFALVCCVAFSAVLGHLHIPINTGLAEDEKTVAEHGGTPVLKLLSLSLAPDRAQRVWPWTEFRQLDPVPDGSTIALVEGNVQALIMPLRGAHLQRDLVVVQPPRDLPDLVRQLRAHQADHVLIDLAPAWDPVRDLVENDPAFAFVTPVYGVIPQNGEKPDTRLYRFKPENLR
ncbi:hypothetical protein [Actinocorallia aurantiaca]|uniref:Glycosyltransferase RgtA/B/C/D-like domain-containing protein n=1 Tax=Actinocorallia aurantiaca TaxID=46204 RepID=A0ABN3U3M3_9ACTN